YNGTFTIVSTPTATTFTYTNPIAGLGTAGGGVAISSTSIAVNSTGTLILGGNGEIPTGSALTLTNGNIQATEAVSLSNNVTLNNSAITFIGSNPITIGREVTTATPATTTTVNGVNNTLTVSIPAGVTIANALNGTAILTKNGTGNLNLLD